MPRKPVTIIEAMEALIALHENLEDADLTKDSQGREYRDCKRARLLIDRWRKETVAGPSVTEAVASSGEGRGI